MKLLPALSLVALPALFTACGQVESHDRLLTHPPRIHGEYVTELASTVDFVPRVIPVDVPGRRPVFGTTTLSHNIILANRKNVLDVTVINPDDSQPLAPHTVTVSFYDGPEGHHLDNRTLETGVIPPGRRTTASLVTLIAPPSGAYYWSYSIQRSDGWEEALQVYQDGLIQDEAATQEDEDDLEWGGDDDWEEDW